MASTLAEEMNRRENWDRMFEDEIPWTEEEKIRKAQRKTQEDELRDA